MKKLILVTLIFITTITLVSCNNDKTKKIGILIYDEHDTFMYEYLKELELKIRDKVYYDVSYAERSQYIQNKQFSRYLDEGFDLIIINAVDRLASPTLIQKAEAKGVPIIFINREPLEELKKSKNSYYVGANSIQMGALQADLVKDMIEQEVLIDRNSDDKYGIIILKGEQGHQDAEKRTSEVIAKLNKLGIKHEILAISVANWSKELAKSETKRLFEEFGDSIDLIISNNDDMALGAIEYLKTTDYYLNNYELQIEIIGVDGTSEGIKAIEQSLMYGTVINNNIEQTKYIDKLIDYLLFDINDTTIQYSSRFLLIDGIIRTKQ